MTSDEPDYRSIAAAYEAALRVIASGQMLDAQRLAHRALLQQGELPDVHHLLPLGGKVVRPAGRVRYSNAEMQELWDNAQRELARELLRNEEAPEAEGQP